MIFSLKNFKIRKTHLLTSAPLGFESATFGSRWKAGAEITKSDRPPSGLKGKIINGLYKIKGIVGINNVQSGTHIASTTRHTLFPLIELCEEILLPYFIYTTLFMFLYIRRQRPLYKLLFFSSERKNNFLSSSLMYQGLI